MAAKIASSKPGEKPEQLVVVGAISQKVAVGLEGETAEEELAELG